MKKIFSVLLIFAVVSCSYRPVLDDNYKYQNTPKDQSEADIDECIKKGDEFLKGRKMKKAGKEAVRKGAIGAFFGGLFGFLVRGDTGGLVRGVAVGAGVGAAVGAGSVAGEGTVTPDQMKQRYVNRCLNEKGYGVLGWE